MAIQHYSITPYAEPTYENGELQHGGSDLDLKGSLPYYAVEAIYCLALLQVLTALLSDKFWWMLLAVRQRFCLKSYPLLLTYCFA